MNTISKESYESLKAKYNRHEKWLNGRTSYPSADVPADCQITNDEIGKIEVYEFVHNLPQKYFLYVNEEKRVVTTFNGEQLGTITLLGAPYKAPAFGGYSTRQSIKIKAINGLTYSGTYYTSSGNYARIKAVKS
jgi:hypothetical protein